MKKDKSLRSNHLLFTRRASILILIINIINGAIIIVLVLRSLWRWRGRSNEATKVSLTMCNTSPTSVHPIQLSSESTKASIHMLKLCHDHLKRHITRERRSRGGWRSRCLGPWPFWSKLDLAPSNSTNVNGMHNGEMIRLRIGDKGVANDPRDSKRKDKFITGCHILIDIYKRENEMRRKVYSKVLNEGQQKASMSLSNRIIVRKGIEKKCYHHIQEPLTFCKSRAGSVLTLIPRRRYLTKERQKFVFGDSPQTWTSGVIRMRFPQNM